MHKTKSPHLRSALIGSSREGRLREDWNKTAANPSYPLLSLKEHVMRPLRYSINVTLDGCCDHRAIPADEDLHRHAIENFAQADALLFGRVTYEMMEAAWRWP